LFASKMHEGGHVPARPSEGLVVRVSHPYHERRFQRQFNACGHCACAPVQRAEEQHVLIGFRATRHRVEQAPSAAGATRLVAAAFAAEPLPAWVVGAKMQCQGVGVTSMIVPEGMQGCQQGAGMTGRLDI
jgi:hypothetical protein